MPGDMVIDPEVPEAAKAELRSMPQAFLLAFSAQAPSASRRFRRSRVADADHRRYVVPELDLDDDAQQAWEHAATAAKRHAQSLNTADIEQRIKSLRTIADLAAEPDDSIRREQAARQLAQLSDSHLDMVPGLGPNGNEQAITRQASVDLRTLIERLGHAIRQASEVGVQNSTLPGDFLCHRATPTQRGPPTSLR